MRINANPSQVLPSFSARHALLCDQPNEIPLSSGQFNKSLPFQRWFPFKEAFSPAFVAGVLAKQRKTVGVVLDPFGGSGTTALTAQHLGWTPVTIEVNPFLADLIETKLCRNSAVDIAHAFSALQRSAKRQRPNVERMYKNASISFIEPGINGRYLFSTSALRRISGYRCAIEKLTDTTLQRFFRVQLASILIPLSNVVVNGKGRRYRQGWETKVSNGDDVDFAFEAQVERAIHDIEADSRVHHDYELLRGDSRVLIPCAPMIDVAVFSPPYPNSFDYTDIYNVELWALGYLSSSEENRSLRMSTIHSHVQLLRPSSHLPVQNDQLNACIESLRETRANLWNKNIPEMVFSYFADLYRVMSTTLKRLSSKGQIVVVVGDSRYDNVYVNVASILEQLCQSLNLQVVEREAIRAMRASPQQGGRMELTESAITFQRRQSN